MTAIASQTTFPDLGRLLRPSSIAVIGASEQRGNLGGIAVQLMQEFGYAGDIWPINPKWPTVHGLPCFDNVAALPGPADMAIIATGAEHAGALVRQCAAAGIRYGIVWAGGYAEIGEAGAVLQDSLLQVCRETGFTLAGPNCIGVINSRQAMVASLASFLVEDRKLLPGDIAMVSQSGGLATTAQALAQRKGRGFGLTISSGNEMMLTVADYIHALAADEETKVIAAYLEGVRDGARFIAAATAARAAGKPLVVLKGGLTATSAQAAAAHTGALAGERRVWEAVASELGLITVSSLEELLDVSLLLSSTDPDRLPKGNGAAIVSFGGGGGVISTDQCAIHGLDVRALQPETLARLAPLVPPIASISNPIDVTPQVFNNEHWFSLFGQALDVIAADPGIDVILCQFGPMAQRGAEIAQLVGAFQSRTAKTVCLAWPLAPAVALAVLEREGTYFLEEYERSIATIGKLARHGGQTAIAPTVVAATSPFDWSRYVPSPAPATVISEHECHRILAAAGLPTARGRLATTASEAVAIARDIGFPLAAKGISTQITHRAAAGLVSLDIRTEADLTGVYDQFVAKARSAGVELEGVYLQEMVTKGMEIIISALRDPIFGIMVSVGAGGNFAELIDDVALARAPLDVASAHTLLQRLRIIGAAGKLNADAELGELAGFVARFSQLAVAAPWSRFVIEINPVKWSARGVTAIDGLILIETP